MKKIKGILLLLMGLSMAFFMLGCSQEGKPVQKNQEVQEVQGFKPGTYTASVPGKNGPIEVSVTFSEKSIDSVEIISQTETVGIADAPIERLPKDIVTYQSVGVDTISGATITSNAILEAVKSCILQANGDPEYWSQPVKKLAGDDEEYNADVVVIGGGSAGMAAASMAREAGASVILIEKASILGGNTARSGAFIAAVDPEFENNFKTSAVERSSLEKILTYNEADFGDYADTLTILKKQVDEYLKSGSDVKFDSVERFMIEHYVSTKATDLDGNKITADFNLVKIFCNRALDEINWLKNNGVSFSKDKLVSTRNQAVIGSGGGFTKAMAEIVDKNGAEVMLDTEATELMVENGKVVGVKAIKSDGTKVTLNANSGVVLATGGFGANIEMCYEYNNFWDGLPDGMYSSNAPTITGDGIKMAEKLNANTVGMGFIQIMMTAASDGSPEKGSSVQIYVNSDGNRFVDDSNTFSSTALNQATFKQPGAIAFAVGDANMYNAQGKEKIDNSVANGYAFVGDTIEEAAQKAGINAENLKATIEKYNGYADAGNDPDFNRKTFSKKLEQGPYVIVPMKPAFHQTMGGLQINTEAQVLNKDGEAIKGLFAAGEVVGGIEAGNRISGDMLAEALAFGRIAGTNAAMGK